MRIPQSRMVKRLAWRSLWRNRRRTWITVSSIGLGLTFAILLVALGEGIYEQMVDNATRMRAGHIVLEHPEYRDAPSVDLWIRPGDSFLRRVRALPGVESVRHIITGQGMARSGSGAIGVLLLGVEPAIERVTSPMTKRIVDGEFLDEDDGAMVMIGHALAKQLKLKAGKKLVLSTNDSDGTLREELCRVKGIFRTGAEEVDGYLVLTPLKFARDLFHLPPDGATQTAIILDSPGKKDEVIELVRNELEGTGAIARPWEEVFSDLAAYIKIDRVSNWTFQALLIIIILFTIFNTILMSVLERKREFAILLAVGTPAGQLQRQVMAETAFLGLVGCGVGLLIGGLISYYFQGHGVDLHHVYKEGLSISGLGFDIELRTKVTIPMLLWIGGIVYVATLLLGIIPMRKAVSVSMVDHIR